MNNIITVLTFIGLAILFLSAIWDTVRNYRKAKVRRLRWFAGADAFRKILTSPLIDSRQSQDQRYQVANALLRRFARDHPKAYREQDGGEPEVIFGTIQRWLDDMVLQKISGAGSGSWLT